jgi:hypothetical protein
MTTIILFACEDDLEIVAASARECIACCAKFSCGLDEIVELIEYAWLAAACDAAAAS